MEVITIKHSRHGDTTVKVVRETPKAILLAGNASEAWFPKAAIDSDNWVADWFSLGLEHFFLFDAPYKEEAAQAAEEERDMSKNEKETLANLIRILSDYKGVAEGLRQRILVLQEKDDTKSDEYFSLLHWHSNAMIKYWETALILFEEWDLQILESWPKDRMEWEIKFWRACHEDHASCYGSNDSERAA